MKKIAILGCENSHANVFLNYIIKDKLYNDIEVVGVYSDDAEAANMLNKEHGVYVAASYDEFVGKVDGVIITARHGDNHYKYAKPYIESGIPMFIDKPITISEKEANEFLGELKERNIKVCGGSVCIFADKVQELKNVVENKEYGDVYGGFLRAPVDLNNNYGNFYFYSQHLVQVMAEIFGYYPKTVKAFRNDNIITCIVRYNDYDVTLEFTNGNYQYHAYVSCEKQVCGSEYGLDGCFEQEFENYYQLLIGNEMHQTYEDFFSSVFILNAIDRSLESGKEEEINYFK